jgi:hypothetical protein
VDLLGRDALVVFEGVRVVGHEVEVAGLVGRGDAGPLADAGQSPLELDTPRGVAVQPGLLAPLFAPLLQPG